MLRNSMAAAVATAFLVAAVQAGEAADIPAPVHKAPAAVVAASWSGAYIGVSVGGRWSDVEWTTTATSDLAGIIIPGQVSADAVTGFDSSTVRAGGYAGYNWQFAPSWVAGVEVDGAWGDGKTTRAGIPGTGITALGVGAGRFAVDHSSVKTNWDASARLRLGYLVTAAWLLYATGGVAFQDVEASAVCDGSPPSWCVTPRSQTFSSIRVGWTAGAGLEGMIAPDWLARVEYRYADFGSFDNTFFAGSPDAVVTGVKVRTHTALAGIARKW